nr:hypothetical protein [Tanacetum cinerariifolium]
AARTMLADAKLPITFWAEAVNTACYVQNRVLVNKSRNKTLYELFNGRTHAIGFLKPFRCHVMILNTLDNLGKFEAKGDEGYFIGYYMSSKAFRVFNKRTKRVEENLHIEFLENKAIEKGAGPNWLFDIDSLTKSMNFVPVVDAGINSTNFSGTKDAAGQEVKKDVSTLRYIALPNWAHDALLESSSSKPQDDCSTDVPESSGNSNPTATSTNPPVDQVETLTVETSIPTVSSPIPIACFTDSQEPSSEKRLISKRVANQVETPSLDNILTLTNRFEDILGVTTNSDESNGVEAGVSNMETTITASPTPTLKIHKDHPKSQIIGPLDTLIQTRNKSKEVGEQSFIATIYQKTDPALLQFCLFSCFLFQVEPKKISDALQDPSWEEGIDYNEVFAPVARIEAIKLFLAYASFMGFTVYQMDVKSAFLYGTIDEEVYVMQPPGFQDPEYPARVYKVEKAISALFIRRQRGDFILVQVYVDDIIFGSSNPQLCREFEALMHEKFQMSAMDVRSSNTPMDKDSPWGKNGTGKDVDLHLYRSMIGSLMYLTASRPDIMFAVFKRIFRYLKGHPKLGLWYPKDSPFDFVAYSDSDYNGATQDRKSTTGGCQFLGRRLISWQCKKQTIVATSTTEAEYVAAASGCRQVLWIQNQLLDYGVDHIHTDENVADLLTKPFDAGRFQYLVISSACHERLSLRESHHHRLSPNSGFCRGIPHKDRNNGRGNQDSRYRGWYSQIVTESSIRRNLKLNDDEGLSFLPDAELFENLTLMGYNISPNQKFTFQKGFNEFSSNIATALVCLATNRTYNFSKMIFDGLVKNVNNKISKFLMYPRFLTMYLRMGQFGQITHTHTYVVAFHTRKLFTTLRVNSPSFSGRIVLLFDTMLIQQGEGSGTPTEPHHTPSPKAQPSSHTHISLPTLPTVTPVFTALIPTVIPSETTPLRQYTRRARIAQSSTLSPVADEHASPIRDVSQGEACPTESGFIADQDRTNIAKTSTLPHESTSRVTSLPADEGSLQLRFQELTNLCTSLQRQQSDLVSKFEAQALEITELKARVKFLEDRQGGDLTHSGDDAPIKGRRLDKGDAAAERLSSDTKEIRLDEGEAAAERVSDDTKEMATVLTSMDAVSLLSSGGVQVVPTAAAVASANVSIPTGSGVVPTASPTISTATPIFATTTTVTSYTRRKGKENMMETDTPKKKKILQEQIDVQVARELEEEMARDAQRMIKQIARDAEIARIHAEEELQIMIDGLDRTNGELITELVRYQDRHSKILQYQAQQRKPRTKKQKRDFYMAVIRNNLGWKVKDFKGMTFEEVEAKFKTLWEQIKGGVSKISNEEAAWLKRKGIILEQEDVKKIKTSEEVHEEVKSTDEVSEEKVKEMIQLVPIKEVYVEALQVKHPIIDWKVHTEGQRSYWKITRLGGSSASYQFFVDMLKQLDREDLNQLWALVKETLSVRPATNEKEMELWIELKRLYEPDADDQLWTHIQHIMHAPVEWRLYDSCGVHHGRIVGNKMHKAFPLPVTEFPLPEEVPTAREESSHCQKKREATAVKIALLLKSKKKLSVKVRWQLH